MRIGALAALPPDTPHRDVWRRVLTADVPRCHYCRELFTAELPPTRDHVVPAGRGGKYSDGYVFACGRCNNARGIAPFSVYERVVHWEHVAAFLEDRPFVRPIMHPRLAKLGGLAELPPLGWQVACALAFGVDQ